MHKNYPLILGTLTLSLIVGWGQSAQAAEPALSSLNSTGAVHTRTIAARNPRRANGRITQLDQEVTLTDDQKTRIQALLDDEAAQSKAVRADQTLSAKDRGAKSAAIRSTTEQQIRQILTSDQQKKLDDQEMQKLAQRQADATIRAMGPGISLTDEEKTKLISIVGDREKQSKTLREDQTLSPRDRGLKLRDLNNSTQEKIDQILTPEQQQKWAENRKQENIQREAANALRKLDKTVTLTEDEKVKLKPILEEQARQTITVREDKTLAARDRGAKLKEIATATMAQVKLILTPEQQQKLTVKNK